MAKEQTASRKRAATNDIEDIIVPPTMRERVSARELEQWGIKQTGFGCLKHLTKHIELPSPDGKCVHNCVCCYVANYPGGGKVMPSKALDAAPAEIEQYIKASAALLWKGVDRLKALECWDGLPPEIHFAVSSDVLAPVAKIQECFFLLARAALANNLNISVVSKGVPYNQDMADRLIKLFATRPTAVSYQCTCGSMDAAKQKLVEPGAPEPKIRLAWASRVKNEAKVGQTTLRMNPMYPGFNDGEEEIRATIDAAAAIGIKDVAFSYVYAAPKIFKNMARGVPQFDNTWRQKYFDEAPASLSGALGKFHVHGDYRLSRHLAAKRYAMDSWGIAIHSCGCDNADLPELVKEGCRICWRSDEAHKAQK
jgi:DNA repair photolyase